MFTLTASWFIQTHYISITHYITHYIYLQFCSNLKSGWNFTRMVQLIVRLAKASEGERKKFLLQRGAS